MYNVAAIGPNVEVVGWNYYVRWPYYVKKGPYTIKNNYTLVNHLLQQYRSSGDSVSTSNVRGVLIVCYTLQQRV